MASHARSAGVLLNYTLTTDPAQVRVSGASDPEPLRLMLRIDARPAQTTYLKKIEIRYRVGDADSALSQTDPSRVGQVVENRKPAELGQPWKNTRKADNGYGIFSFEPDISFDPCEFLGDNTVRLALTGITVNEAIGAAFVEVTEWASHTPDDYQPRALEPIPINKGPRDFTFENLRPHTETVQRGNAATLDWDASHGPKYTMHWNLTDRESVTGLRTWTSPELDRTTAFMLLAELTVEGGGAPLIYAMTTAVTVTEPNLDVGNLTVNGTVQIQGARQRLTGWTPGDVRYYRSPTDGILIGYLKGGSGQSIATMLVTVSRSGVNEYTMNFTSDNTDTSIPPTESPISVPVPKDAQIRVHVRGDTGTTLDMSWLPRGVGDLDEIPPPDGS